MRESTKNNVLFCLLLSVVVVIAGLVVNSEISKIEEKALVILEIEKTRLEIEKLKFELAIYREQETLVANAE